jgi:hypothetical protein
LEFLLCSRLQLATLSKLLVIWSCCLSMQRVWISPNMKHSFSSRSNVDRKPLSEELYIPMKKLVHISIPTGFHLG